jgi:hypothetical protein
VNIDNFNKAQATYDNMLPPDDEIPEVPSWKIQEKLQEWVQDVPEWLYEKLEEACIEDYLTYRRSRGRYP